MFETSIGYIKVLVWNYYRLSKCLFETQNIFRFDLVLPTTGNPICLIPVNDYAKMEFRNQQLCPLLGVCLFSNQHNNKKKIMDPRILTRNRILLRSDIISEKKTDLIFTDLFPSILHQGNGVTKKR